MEQSDLRALFPHLANGFLWLSLSGNLLSAHGPAVGTLVVDEEKFLLVFDGIRVETA